MGDEDEYWGPKSIVIDNGSFNIKAGFNGDEIPKISLRNVIGENKDYDGKKVGNEKEIIIGEEALNKRGMLNIKFPMKRSMIKDWESLEKIWNYIFTNELKVNQKEYNVLITQPINNIKENKEKIAEIMFESFNIPGLYIADSTLLSLYAAGKFTGMVIDMGDGITQFSPFYDGFLFEDKFERINIGGKDITKYMRKILNKKGFTFEKISGKIIPNTIKEEACFFPLTDDEEVGVYEYKLPDGSCINLKEERFNCPEAILFNPLLKSNENKSIAEICNNIIQKCDVYLKKDFYNCIILSGGNSMLKGLPERFTKEIKDLVNESMKKEITVIANPERKFATWIGGSILSGISTFDDKWTTNKEYEENGPNIIINRF